MNVEWTILGVGIAVAVAVLARSWRRRHQNVDLGTVSDHWISEQRLGQGHDQR